MRGWKSVRTFAAAVAIAAASAGCTAVPSMSDIWFGPPSEPTPEMKAEAERIASLPTYTMEVRYDGYEAKRKEIPLEEVVFVQDAIDKSGVKGNMGRMKVFILRPQPGMIEPLRLPCDYDARKKIVANNMNYQIRPGDRLYLVEDPTTPLDDIVSSIFPSGEKTPSVWNNP